MVRVGKRVRGETVVKQEPILATRCSKARRNRQKWEGVTDRRTDRPSYGGASQHLKIIIIIMMKKWNRNAVTKLTWVLEKLWSCHCWKPDGTWILGVAAASLDARPEVPSSTDFLEYHLPKTAKRRKEKTFAISWRVTIISSAALK